MNNHTQQPDQYRWRSDSYPVQSSVLPTSMASSLGSTWKSEEGPVQLPRSIRAVRESGSAAAGGRNLVICLDGTGDQFDDDNSNVVNFVACLKKDDPRQITYYQSGIGTYDGSGLKKGFSAAVDMAVGSGLGIHIKDAYRFLMQNYHEGDKICLLGFSRGAYTVRCLTGMLHKVGLLPAHNRAQIEFAYNHYKDDSDEGWESSRDFKKTFCTDVTVYFVGVWDCVASVGFIPRKLPFSKSPTKSIGYFRHAMALDEHRAKFKVCQYMHQNPDQEDVNPTILKTPGARASRLSHKLVRSKAENEPVKEKRELKLFPFKRASTLAALTEKEEKKAWLAAKFEGEKGTEKLCETTDVLEVWFCGGHADVGGGAVKNWKRHVLARIPLRWMIRQCFECNTGIIFNTSPLAETGIDVSSVWPIYKDRKKPVVGPSPSQIDHYLSGNLSPIQRRSTVLGIEKANSSVGSDAVKGVHQRHHPADLLPEHVEDYFDATAPINDQLQLAKGWWILEFWPVKIRIQKKKSHEWEKVVRLNLGRFRAIRQLEPKMHWTVEQRIHDKGYEIRNRVDRQAHWKVVA